MKQDKKIDTLTQRQNEIFQLILMGQNNHEIAESLGITYGTAKLMSHKVLKKLGLKSKTQALVKYLR